MAKIITTEDCGSAPKRQYIMDFSSLANGEIENATDMLADNIELEIVGTSSVAGKDAVRTEMNSRFSQDMVTTLNILNILSHGAICAANGVWHNKNGNQSAFNTMYTFDGYGLNLKSAKSNSLNTLKR